MNQSLKKLILGISIFIMIESQVNAQYANRKISKKKQAYTDSLKQVEYNYIFPFLGQKVYKLGFDIPYPIGIMANFIGMDQGIIINNFRLGVQSDNRDIPLTNIDDIISFDDNRSVARAYNFRPDIWIFPFLNVYGIFGSGTNEMTVNVVEPVPLTSVVKQTITTAGFGLMGAFGLGPLWVSLDWNQTYNKAELVEKAVQANTFGVRIGKTFTFRSHPERNIAFWAGGWRARLQSETLGEIQLIDALPPEVWENRDQFVEDYNTWYDGLPPRVQERVNDSAIPGIIESIENADGDTIIRYGMDKGLEGQWSGVFGGQFQYNKRWMLRTEWGLIGDRKSGMVSLNYRFLL